MGRMETVDSGLITSPGTARGNLRILAAKEVGKGGDQTIWEWLWQWIF